MPVCTGSTTTRALVQTVDFFTPIVDDPFVYGQIAAANALSDVYAMGGRPLTALAIAAFPEGRRPRRSCSRSSPAASTKLREAGVALLGGHTVQDAGDQVRLRGHRRGRSRTRVLANAGARPGDVLLLTKPLGTGIIATALKFGRAPPRRDRRGRRVDDRAEPGRGRGARRRCRAGAVHACTDITGFGLIGHASEMAAASGCTLEIDAEPVPLLAGARALVRGNIPGGGRTNREHFGGGVEHRRGARSGPRRPAVRPADLRRPARRGRARRRGAQASEAMPTAGCVAAARSGAPCLRRLTDSLIR